MIKENNLQPQMKPSHFVEAEAAGLTLLGFYKEGFSEEYKTNYRYYKINSCGHFAYFQITHVRMKNISCKVCNEQEYKLIAANSGYTYLGQDYGSYHKFRVDSCGHEVSRTIANIRSNKKNSQCKVCYEQEVIPKLAEKHDLTYVGKAARGGIYRTFMFNSCSHEKVIGVPSLERIRPVCKICQTERYEEEAQKEGLTLLPDACLDSLYRYYLLPCGCKREIRVDHVKHGRWCCYEHSEIYYTKESYLYLTEFTGSDFSWLKFGFSHNIEERTKNYGVPSGYSAETLFSVKVKSGYFALEVEKEVHRLFKHMRLCKNEMTKFHKHNGHTECYPTIVALDIIEEVCKQLAKKE